MRVSIGSDHSCRSHVQTRAYDVGPFPLVGLADIRISVSWDGGGHVNPTLLVKLHGKKWVTWCFHKLLDYRQEEPVHTSEATSVMLV